MGYLGVGPKQAPVIHEVGVGLPVGTIVEFPRNKISAGFLKTTGEVYNPATFPALYDVLKTDVLPYRDHEVKLGGVKWFTTRDELGPDFVPADGQTITNGFVLYPDLLSLISASQVPNTLDSTWLAEPSMRGCYTTTPANKSIRVPDYNGKSEGSLGAVVLRGDGKNAANPGVIQGDAIRNITGGIRTPYAEMCVILENQLGAFYGDGSDVSYLLDVPKLRTSGYVTPTNVRKTNTRFDASREVPTGPENRMVNTAGCWGVRVQVSTEFAIKAFDNITPEGLVEVAGLVQENIELRQAIDELNSWPQSGSNANGSWVKHKDGTLICTHVLSTVPTIDVRDYIPGLKQHLFTWEFPHKFYTAADDSYRVPMISGDMRDNSISGFLGGSTILYTGGTAHGARMVYISPTSKLTAVLCTLQAIGRWK